VQDSGGFGSVELNRILALVTANRDLLLDAWNDYFNG
jgi:hypothetical protein